MQGSKIANAWTRSLRRRHGQIASSPEPLPPGVDKPCDSNKTCPPGSPPSQARYTLEQALSPLLPPQVSGVVPSSTAPQPAPQLPPLPPVPAKPPALPQERRKSRGRGRVPDKRPSARLQRRLALPWAPEERSSPQATEPIPPLLPEFPHQVWERWMGQVRDMKGEYRFFARLRSFDIACPRCGDVHIVRWRQGHAFTRAQTKVARPSWDPLISRWQCRSCSLKLILGVLAWDGSAIKGKALADHVPTLEECIQIREAFGGGVWIPSLSLAKSLKANRVVKK